MKKKLLFILLFLGMGIIISPVLAMDSTNYQISPDVLDESGGYSTSTNFKLYQNLGETTTHEAESTNYKLYQGFLQPDKAVLSFNISPDAVDFGTLTPSLVSSGNITIRVSSSSKLGFSVKAYDNTDPGIANGLIYYTQKIADATTPNNYIGLPLAGTEHYGITVTGTHAASGYAGGTKINSLDDTSWVDIGSYNNKVNNDTYTVNFRAGASEDTAAGSSYTAVTTFILTVNY